VSATPTSDRDVESWLAAATGTDAGQVHRELAQGELRRAFVADELLEAGFTGGELIDYVMRLTGLDARQARSLVEARARKGA